MSRLESPRGRVERDAQLRAGLVLMGAWWGLFSLPAMLLLKDRSRPRTTATGVLHLARGAMTEVRQTLSNLRAYRTLAWFLLGVTIDMRVGASMVEGRISAW